MLTPGVKGNPLGSIEPNSAAQSGKADYVWNVALVIKSNSKERYLAGLPDLELSTRPVILVAMHLYLFMLHGLRSFLASADNKDATKFAHELLLR